MAQPSLTKQLLSETILLGEKMKHIENQLRITNSLLSMILTESDEVDRRSADFLDRGMKFLNNFHQALLKQVGTGR